MKYRSLHKKGCMELLHAALFYFVFISFSIQFFVQELFFVRFPLTIPALVFHRLFFAGHDAKSALCER